MAQRLELHLHRSDCACCVCGRYRDLMLSVLHTGPLGLRIVGELQFHDERMYALKIQMHRLYKVKRAASASSI